MTFFKLKAISLANICFQKNEFMSYSLLLFKVSPHLQKYQTNSYRLLGRYVKVLMLLFGMV
jgi:hypothetical protein